MLIGICGKAGAGKDTVGDYLIKDYGFKKIALADPIKRLVKDVFVLDDHTVYDRVAREQPLENWNNWSVRKLLQFIGTELFRTHIDDEIWVKSLWYNIQQDKMNNYVVTDVRFPNELQFFRDHAKNNEFVCLKIIRSGCNGKVGLAGHASEAYDLVGDFDINNNGSYEELYVEVDEMMKNLKMEKNNDQNI
jgi:dephospho-CoA kinase